MDILFTVVLGWFCLTSIMVFTQTNSYGHLMISLGAAFMLITFLLLNYASVGWVVLIAGRILFFGGFAVIATFERAWEKERLQASSWKEILLGRVPERLQMHKVSERSHVVQALLIALLFALIFYTGNRQQEALSFLVIAIVFAAYLGALGFKDNR